MAYALENERDEYRRHRLRVDTGEEPGPHITFEEWLEKQKKDAKKKEEGAKKKEEGEPDDLQLEYKNSEMN